jgi:DNA polymerase-4
MLLHPSQRILVHLDMNSFFASVEQQANPRFRDRPLGVCAYLHEQGCVIAASREAKRFGMKVGMRVSEAREQIPHAVFVQNDPPKYRSVISQVFALLHELTDTVEYYSIDEAFLDLTGWCRDYAEAAFLMRRIQERITSEVGDWLTCSVGIAPTRLLAKLGSDLRKPNGLTILTPEILEARAERMPMQAICGVGPRLDRRFKRHGIRSIAGLLTASPEHLLRFFGKQGFLLWSELHGYEGMGVGQGSGEAPRSIGHSFCVPERVNREGLVVPTLLRLLERAVRRMRTLRLAAHTLVVTVGVAGSEEHRYGWGVWNRTITSEVFHFPEPIQDSFTFAEAALELLGAQWNGSISVSFLAVTLIELSPWSTQARLDDLDRSWKEKSDQRIFLSQAMDKIRDRYGLEAVQFGSMVALRGNEAPDRIGFRKTDGVDVQASAAADVFQYESI